MKYQFKEGDGVTHLTCTVQEREEVYKLLKKNKYPSHSNYTNNVGWYNANQFQNNFRFNAKGKWVTSSRQQVTNPLTYEQIKNLIETGGEPQYEIY